MGTNDAGLSRPAIQDGTALLLEGRIVEGSKALAEALSRGESAELWNNWAVGQLMLAEKGFRRALEMEPTHGQAAANLGVLLFSIGKYDEAREFLEQARAGTSGAVQSHLQALLGLCGKRGNASPYFFLHPDHAPEYRQIGLLRG